MKRSLLFIFFLFSFSSLFAKHITGGEVLYDYLGPGASNSKLYRITLRLFRDNLTMGGAPMPASVTIGLYNNETNTLVGGLRNIPLNGPYPVGVIASPPCLSNTPVFDYSMGLYVFDVDLPNNNGGFTVTYQTCCRVDGITNGGANEGATYTSQVPGNNTLAGGITDNSARFVTGISIICYQKPFILDFSASDPDGDSLVYAFTDAYNGGDAQDAGFADPAPPPYGSINYYPGYSGHTPLGPNATINPATGIISGIAPDAGKYVVSVIVYSYRNGQLISEHRKDFIVTVAPCDFASADLDITHSTCDGLTVNFHNNNSSALNLTFDWDFADPASGANNTSTQEFPTHVFSTPGDYNVRLIVNRGTPCADTAYSLQRVWPGFRPAFAPIPPTCKNIPVQFTDATTTDFPPVNYWHWDFGDLTTAADTSRMQNPVYTYSTAGTYHATFIVQTEKGCRDTLYPDVMIVDKPVFFVTNDTLICTVDTLQLHSNITTGNITWSPNYMISDIHSFNPLVSPDVTTTYTAFYSDPSGCSATDDVKVSVISDVTLLAINDTSICRTDTAQLTLTSDALYYAWTPTGVITDPTAKNPVIFPVAPVTVFHVKASVSNKCFKETDITVRTQGYPNAKVTGDSLICYGRNAQLHATGGSFYFWSPPAYLNSVTSPDPLSVAPKSSLTYTVIVKDTLGCPKPVSKNFTVKVIRLFAEAGPSDTSVVTGQPVLLQGSGGTANTWTPTAYLQDPGSQNPTAYPLHDITYKLVVNNEIGCTASDTIRIHVYDLPPGIYVPSAFTPTGDGKNDIFRPILLGIRSLEYFRIFTRWGQLIYETNKIGEGWDGRFNGKEQDPAAYVWEGRATDYKGQSTYKKGTVILIR